MMQVFKSFSLTLATLLVCWKLHSFNSLVQYSCEYMFSFNIYIECTVHVILIPLLNLYFVTIKASHGILLVLLLDTILYDLLLYTPIYTNSLHVLLCFCFCIGASIYISIISIQVNSSYVLILVVTLYSLDLFETYP